MTPYQSSRDEEAHRECTAWDSASTLSLEHAGCAARDAWSRISPANRS